MPVTDHSGRSTSVKHAIPRALYKRALAGEIKNLTGVDQPYETPENPEILLDTGHKDAERLAHDVIEDLSRRGILK